MLVRPFSDSRQIATYRQELRHNYWRKSIYAPFFGAIIDIVRQQVYGIGA
jgi:hypothetical protein